MLLKPNLVDYIPGDAINTHPLLVLAAAESFRRLGAKSVLVAEGPGHQRDTHLVLSQSGYEQCLRDERIRFVDLNRDQLIRTALRASYTGMRDLWLPRAVLEADFLVSMPKIKTHHWSGVTLSMKNMFGVVPGARYGWPKNILHWKGIQESILDLCATVPVHFVIADGIVAMEGNGPLNGTARAPGKDRACRRSGGCRRNLRAIDGIRTRKNRAHPRGVKISWQRFSCTHRPGWRNRQCFPLLHLKWFPSFNIFGHFDTTFVGWRSAIFMGGATALPIHFDYCLPLATH